MTHSFTSVSGFFGRKAVRLAIAACAVAAFGSMPSLAKASVEEPFDLDSILTPAELDAEFGSGESSSDVNINRLVESMRETLDPSARIEATHSSVESRLTDELLSYYEAVFYINKAERGSTAQTMRVLVRDQAQAGKWVETQRLKVSTGREKQEQYFTSTPVGLFNLDGERFYKMAYSGRWGGAPMPFAMFFDVQFATRKTGIAIHGTSAENKLGSRASGGCIRVKTSELENIYQWVTRDLAGDVPKFVWDRKLKKTSPDAVIEVDGRGNPVLKKGYKALVVVVNAID
ncbi:MAG: L,D-transpeptidase [Bdellovibrionales bacterium]|jgi:hypothetical protein|nr:L,D-transpeptidase [Bdellovibrionales bacterium]